MSTFAHYRFVQTRQLLLPLYMYVWAHIHTHIKLLICASVSVCVCLHRLAPHCPKYVCMCMCTLNMYYKRASCFMLLITMQFLRDFNIVSKTNKIRLVFSLLLIVCKIIIRPACYALHSGLSACVREQLRGCCSYD